MRKGGKNEKEKKRREGKKSGLIVFMRIGKRKLKILR